MMRNFTDLDLHAYTDDRVGPERRDAIAIYLKAAPTDSARVNAWRRQGDAIRTSFAAVADEPVPLWLTVGQIAAATDKPVLVANDGDGRRPTARGAADTVPLRVSLLLAAVAFAAGVGVASMASRSTGQPIFLKPANAATPTLIDRALEAHRTFAVDPDDPAEVIDQPPGALRAWLSRRVAFPIRVPDWQKEALMLKGGRVTPGRDGPAALLIYEKLSGERISLLMDRMSPGSPSSSEDPQADALAWTGDGIGYAVVATGNGAWLVQHSAALRAATASNTDP